MMKNKHLASNDRSLIQQCLTEGKSFKHMGRELGKDPSTISKEIRCHVQFKKTGCYGMAFNNCLIRKACPVKHLCGNSCETKNNCTLEKRLYTASAAQKEYEETRSEALRLSNLISPLLLKGQSLHHVCANHADEIMYHERTLYHYVDRGIFSARNIHMPRVMRMGKRKPTRSPFKVDRKCRIGRT